MTEKTDIAVAEQPQQLMTIEPTRYVALVFENHRTRADAYKAEAPAVTYDITTTAGMKTAVEWRAKGRDIRFEVTDIHKERKAPILEIGRLMDARKKEIIADVEPGEDRFDRDIKAETARKESEKAAKLAAEAARIAAIRSRIDAMRNKPAEMVGHFSANIGAAADHLSETVIALTEYFELTGEAVVERDHAVKTLREMQAKQLAVEQEQQRIADARAQLERDQAAAEERERVAAAERAEQQRKDREALEREEARLLAQRQADEAKLLAEREAEQRKLDDQRREFERQQAELAAQQQALREATEKLAREQRAREEAEALVRQIEADHAEALIENARIDAERVAAFEARKQEEQRRADEAERLRRLRVNFEMNGPGDDEIVEAIANRFDVTEEIAVRWLMMFDAAAFIKKLEKAA